MSRSLRSPLALLALGSILGNAVAGEVEAAPQSEEELRHEVVRLRQENTVAEVELRRLRDVIAALEAELLSVRRELEQQTSGGDAPGGSEAVLPREVSEETEAPLSQPVVLEEDLSDEELGEAPSPTVDAQTAGTNTEKDAPGPGTPEPGAPEPGAPEPGAPEPGAPEPGAPEPGAKVEITAEARALYDQSYTLFHEKRYLESEQGFRRFLEIYPMTDLADNAQFWIGECRFARGEYESALQAFMLTVERYHDGNKIPDALFKAGRCLESLGDEARARATYEEVGRRFPSSSAAIAAQERLSDLR